MDKFIIKGPCKVKGVANISASKNSALPILASTLLFDKPVTIENLPQVRDIHTMLNLLKSLGSKIISPISHDKLRWFLEDMGIEEYGIEENDTQLSQKLIPASRNYLILIGIVSIRKKWAKWMTTTLKIWVKLKN